ncbi:MAG TPA: GGDEF domain-containing protein, partial [Acetobacteraceae bacterium]
VRVVLEHEAIQHEMASQARTDPLTGLLNRRAFLEELPRHIDRLERDGMPGTLMFADLDNFKSVNDRLGHDVGDQMLCAAADLLRRTFRPTDLVARLGGDEFAIWLNGADHMTAAERAERLRVEGPRLFAELTDDASPVGFSIGIAPRRSGGGEEIDAVMRRADLAMYEVKRSGRGHWRVSLEEAT